MEKPLIEVEGLKFSKWLKEFAETRNGLIALVILAGLVVGCIVGFSIGAITLGIILGAVALIFSLLLYGLFWYESALEYGVTLFAVMFLAMLSGDRQLYPPKR